MEESISFEKVSGKEFVHGEIGEKNALAHIDRLENAFIQISSAVCTDADSRVILETILREAAACLKSHRCTLFLINEMTGMLSDSIIFEFSGPKEDIRSDPEKEIAQKVLLRDSPVLIHRLEDFSGISFSGNDGHGITSLMSIPIYLQGRRRGVLSTVIIGEEGSGYIEKDLHFFSAFAKWATIVLERNDMARQLETEKVVRISYERYLDATLYDLQVHSQAEDNIQGSLPPQFHPQAGQVVGEKETWVYGTISSAGKSGIEQRQGKRIETILRVEFRQDEASFTRNLSKGGAFIQTTNPLDMGEHFKLKLHLLDGRKPIETICKVMWTNKNKINKAVRKGMGVMFLNLSQEDTNRIEEYIRSRKVEGLDS